MGVATKIKGGRNIAIRNCVFSGFDIGIDAERATDLEVLHNSFATRVAVKGRHLRGMRAEGNIHAPDAPSVGALQVPWPPAPRIAIWHRWELPPGHHDLLYKK